MKRLLSQLVLLLISFVAAITFSLYTALSRKYAKKISGLIQSAGGFLIGSIVWLFVFDFVLGLIDQPVYIPNSNIFERLCVSVF